MTQRLLWEYLLLIVENTSNSSKLLGREFGKQSNWQLKKRTATPTLNKILPSSKVNFTTPPNL